MFKWKNKTLDGFEQDKIKKNFLPYSILVAALFAMTFFGVCTPNTGPSGPKGPAAYIDDETISFREFRRAYNNQTQSMRSQYGEDYDPAKLRIAQNTLNQLVSARLDYLYGLDVGIVASQNEVVKFLASADAFKDENGNFSDANFKNFLRSYGYTEAGFYEEWERNLTVQKLNRLITGTSFVSSDSIEIDYLLSETKMNLEFIAVDSNGVAVEVVPSEVDAFLADTNNDVRIAEYYNSNSQEYNRPERVKASHILISYKDARNASGDAAKRTKEAAKNLADKVAKEAKQGSFSKLAKKYTDEPSGKKSGGDLGFFTRNMMVKEFSDAAFALKVNQVSGVVESPFGFHIIKVTAKEKAVNKKLDDVKKDIAKTLVSESKGPEAAKKIAESILENLNEKKSISKTLKSNGLKWEETGEFNVASAFIPKMGASPAIRNIIFKNTKDGAIVSEVVEAEGKYFVVKVKKYSPADTKKLDEEKKDQLLASASFSQGYLFYSALSRANREAYEQRNAIKLNNDYLKLDDPAGN